MKKIVIAVSIVMSLTIGLLIYASAYYTPLPTNTNAYPYWTIVKSGTYERLIYSQTKIQNDGTNLNAVTPCDRYSSNGGAQWGTVQSTGASYPVATYTYVDGNYNPFEETGVSPSPSEEPSPSPSEDPSPSPSVEPSPSPSVEPSPLPEGGFKTIIQPILGDYLPTITAGIEVVTAETDTGLVTTTTTKDIVVPDYLWIASAVIFTITLYTVLRLLGSIAQGGASKWRK